MNEQECTFVGLSERGLPVVELDGQEKEVSLPGISVPVPPSQTYVEIFERLKQMNKPFRYSPYTELPDGRVEARLWCFGWQDKSGDVWLDLAQVLLDAGVVHKQEQG